MRLSFKVSSTVLSSLLIIILAAPGVAAMCIWFIPPERQFTPDDNIKTLLVMENNDNNLVVQPGFSGTATDFALVMPFPSQPELVEPSEDVFTDLENLTNPKFGFDGGAGVSSSDAEDAAGEGVEVVKQENIGDYTATTLKADSSSELLTWLDDNGYQVTDENRATLDYYVENKTAFFVALKVNIDKADVDKDGFLKGALRPLQFDFSSNQPTLPLRLMEGEGNLVTLTIYTIAENSLYIPGAEIQFMRKVTATDIKNSPSLEPFSPRSQWLTRNVIQFDPKAVETDIELLTTTQTVVIDSGDPSVVLNPDQLDGKTGLLVSERGEVIYTEDESTPGLLDNDIATSSTSLWVVTVILGVSNVILLALLSNDKKQTVKSD